MASFFNLLFFLTHLRAIAVTSTQSLFTVLRHWQIVNGLRCYSCVKVSPPSLCSKSSDDSHPPCRIPFSKSHTASCEVGESCVAVTQVHVGKVLNVFGCYNCEEMLAQVPGIKCSECSDDLCNEKAPTSCDMV